MKNLFKIVMTLLAGVMLSTSCGVNGESSELYTTMATVVESVYSSSPYYIVFDDGKTAAVENYNKWNPTFPESVSELRYIITYEILDEKLPGFDNYIRIVSTTHVTSRLLEYVTAENFTGDKGLQNYTGGTKVDVVMLSDALNYITLMVYYQGENSYTVPEIRLVCNQPETSPYKDLYVENDGYLYLELYYNDAANKGNMELGTFVSYKTSDVKGILNYYKGIKFISINPTTNQPEVFTHNFHPEQ